MPQTSHVEYCSNYAERLSTVMQTAPWEAVGQLIDALADAHRRNAQVFLCGNGGSDGNANHLANDLIYGIARNGGRGLRAISLTANSSVLTCLGNDLGYHEIFARQLHTLATAGDLLVALSGSGNSKNVIAALQSGQALGLRSFAILGYDGGQAKTVADIAIHFPINDMQIAEDMQLIVGHMVMQRLCELIR